MEKEVIQLWDKQDYDTPKSYEAFLLYRDLPLDQRTLQKVADTLGKSVSLINRWSSQKKWKARVAAYDRFFDKKTRQERAVEDEKAKLDMVRRQTNWAVLVQNRIAQTFKDMRPFEWKKLPFRERIQAYKIMADHERLSRGLPTGKIEHTTPEQERQQRVMEARMFYEELISNPEFADASEAEKVEITCEEFEIEEFELGVTIDHSGTEELSN